jgi:predicted nucleic acid-binding protein
VITAYLDASALVRLAIDEPETNAVRTFIGQFDQVATSRIGLVETRRVVKRVGGDMTRASEVLASVGPIELDAAIAASAAAVDPSTLKTLDAIHLASALALYAVDAFVTYDERLAVAARAAGLTVASPA